MSLHRMIGVFSLVALAWAGPSTAEAQFVRNIMNGGCCNVCQQPVCCCATTRPVIETRMRPQQCVTYQDRKRIATRTEPVCETVPVTKVDCVTVDEGCYQMVWVPKPVTKSIPRTEYHQRTSYRTVPFEVCEKVPVVTTHLVPEQTIRYITEHRSVTTTPAMPYCAPQPACPTPGYGAFGMPSMVPGAFGGVPGGYAPQPAYGVPQGGYGVPRGGYGGGYGVPSGGHGLHHLGHPGLPGIPGITTPIGTPAGFGEGPVAVPYSASLDSNTGVTTASGESYGPTVPDARYADATQPLPRAMPVPRAVGNRPATGFRSPSAAAVWQTPGRTR